MPFGSLPSGTFSSPNAGRLQITLIAQYYSSTTTAPGFPSGGGGAGNLAIKGYAGPSGAPFYTPVMERYNSGTVRTEVDYPGGNVAWPCGVVEHAFIGAGSGVYTIGFSDIQLIVRLKKR